MRAVIDKDYEPTEPLLLSGEQVYTTRYEEIKKEEYWCDFFYVEALTGLRRGEICGLKWSDIDFWYQNFSKPKIRLTTQLSYEG